MPVTSNITIARRFVGLLPGLMRGRPAGRFTAGDLLERAARRHGNDVFVRFQDQSWTYAEINALANRVAHWAGEQGLGRGAVVGLLMQNRPEFLAMWLGLAKLGVVTALLNTNLRGDALIHSLKAADCRVVLAGVECAEAWRSLGEEQGEIEVYWLGDSAGQSAPVSGGHSLDAAIAAYGEDNPPRQVRETLRGGDPLFFIYTSGTTGLPKAARLSHSRFMGGGSYAILAGFGKHDVFYCTLPLYHTSGGVMCVHAVLCKGATLALADHFSVRRFWDDVARYRATAFQYIGELCRYLVNQPPRPDEGNNTLRLAVGNGLRPDIWPEFQQRFGVEQVVEFYGATESNIAMVNLQGRVGSIGRPFPGVKTALVKFDPERNDVLRGPDGRCLPCDVDEPGELLGHIAEGSSAAGRFEGYTSRKATEEKILRDVVKQGDAWFRTGDLLSRDRDGFYFFVDRVGDTFRWKGENVSTQEVAGALTALPEINLCAVYGVEVPGADGRAGMAAVVLEPGAELDGAALYAALEETLPAYARPAFVRVQQDAEVTGTFKLRKAELQKEGYKLSADSDDPISYRDERQRAYLPLDAAVAAKIEAGKMHF